MDTSLINFNTNSTYIIYYLIIIFSSFFAFLSQMFYKNKIANKFFWYTSFLILYIPVAFRYSGVDHDNYSNIYHMISEQNFFDYFKSYSGFPEPLFALLNLMVSILFDDFHYVYIISAFISLFFIYKSFEYHSDKIDLSICVWLFCVTYYFYIYGLVRYSIALGIVMYSYRYLEKNNKKFIVFIIFATGFHYASIFMIIPYILITTKSNGINGFIFKMFFITLVFLIIFYILSNTIFSNSVIFERYKGYFEIDFREGSFNGFLWILPIVVLMFIFRNELNYVRFKNEVLSKMLIIALFLILLNFIFPIHRIVYMFYFVFYYFYSTILQLPFNYKQKKIITLIFKAGMFVFGILWVNRMIFSSIYWHDYIIPYTFNIPIK